MFSYILANHLKLYIETDRGHARLFIIISYSKNAESCIRHNKVNGFGGINKRNGIMYRPCHVVILPGDSSSLRNEVSGKDER